MFQYPPHVEGHNAQKCATWKQVSQTILIVEGKDRNRPEDVIIVSFAVVIM
jgi:hypothetical protein